MRNDNFIFVSEACDNFADFFGDFFLSFGSSFAVFLEGVATKGDDDARFHILIIA